LAAVHFVPNGVKFGKPAFKCEDGYVFKGQKKGTGGHVSGLCEPRYCDRTIYPLSSKPDAAKGTIISCQSAQKFYYGFSSCNRGYYASSGDCFMNDCSKYPYTSKPDTTKGVVNNTPCILPDVDKYQYSSCNEGWDYSNGDCKVHTCPSNYPYTSNPGTQAGTVISCKTGTAYKYGYSACNDGWDKSGGYCNVHVCDATVYPNASCDSHGSCTTCKTGSTTKYSAPTCKSGYTLSSGKCVAGLTFEVWYLCDNGSSMYDYTRTATACDPEPHNYKYYSACNGYGYKIDVGCD